MARKRKELETHVHITPAGLETLSRDIWGDQWRAKFSEVTGISYSQLHRYMTVYNGQMIPQVVVVALEGLRMLKTGPEGTPMLSIAEYRRPIAEATPVKFVQEKRPKPERINNDAPIEDYFGLGEPTKEPATPAAPEPAATVEEPPAAPAPEPAKVKPATPKKAPARTGKAGPETGKGKAGTGAGQAKKPAAKAKPAATPKKPAPKRAALAKA